MNRTHTFLHKARTTRIMRFSTRMVLQYTCIVVLPLAVAFMTVAVHYRMRQLVAVGKRCEQVVAENVVHMQTMLQTMQAMESAILANRRFMDFISAPENYTTSEVVDNIRLEGDAIERSLTVSDVYAVRIFTENTSIPERFPIILHQRRGDATSVEPIKFNYVAWYMGGQDYLKLPSVCLTRPLQKSRRSLGYLQVSVTMQKFFPFLYERTVPSERDYVFKFDKKNSSKDLTQITNDAVLNAQGSLSATDEHTLSLLYAEAASSGGKARRLHIGKGTAIVSWRQVPELGLVTFHVCGLRPLRQHLMSIAAIGAGMFLLLSLVFFFIIYLTTIKMLKGVYTLIHSMKKVRGGDFSTRIVPDGADEIGEAQQTFNQMAARLEQQIAQIKEEQQLITDTEMKAMQNQINAHFLYNVLETIRMQAVIANDDSVAESITVLGKMMRYCLRWRVHTVTIEKEVEYIRSYLYIMNIRNDYTVTLHTNIAPHLLGREIPKMLLQPLVENACIHAIEPLEKDAEIIVSATEEPEASLLYLSVQDFGTGMTAEQVERLLSYLAPEQKEHEGEGSIGIKKIGRASCRERV